MTAAASDPPPPPVPLAKRRGVELSLLVCAVLCSVLGYADVGLAHSGAVPPDVAGYGTGLGLLALLAHLAVRLCAPYADPLLLPIAVLLNGLGLVLIYRLDLETPADRAAPTQLVWSALGVALFAVVVVCLRDHRLLRRYAYVSVAAALALLILPIFFPAVNGARIWVRVGGLSFQPGEFAKILLAVFFAAYLAANGSVLARRRGRGLLGTRLPPGRVLAPVVAVWLTSVGVLVLERDLGTSLLFFGLFVIMLYVATGRTGWIALGLLLAAAGAYAVGSLEPHVNSRVEDWLHPFASIEAGQGPGQLAQSLFAFAAGGMFGSGLGLGHSSLIGFAAKSDFILATAGEELGLAGLTALFLLYALLVARGYRSGLALRDPFGRLLATGLASILALQVFVIAGGVMGLIPLTGMAMPFLAQGGSSVVTNWIMVALLIRLSDSARDPRGGPLTPGPATLTDADAPPADTGSGAPAGPHATTHADTGPEAGTGTRGGPAARAAGAEAAPPDAAVPREEAR
ncbi:FtsW/RodA/SpoVE family cell cycle protein [Streptomyces sp. CC77]|uniref:FtsW/RodA/SpoVE family cell cycle protein n=1 Tax=Streptomyces sp. CC77 TaxID=1906739 RepID=UPI0008DD1598|nr:FtsW/RodA/SpoVE family cell cycle protein [Streptomyces sp. CC77]OII68232.1 cell division protein FtsW [Streptomyces sp. CC77]